MIPFHDRKKDDGMEWDWSGRYGAGRMKGMYVPSELWERCMSVRMGWPD